MSSIEPDTDDIERSSLNAIRVGQDVNVSVHDCLGLEERRIFVVDVSATLYVSDAVGDSAKRRICFSIYLFETTILSYKASWMSSKIRTRMAEGTISSAVACIRAMTALLNLRASCDVRAGKKTCVNWVEGSASAWLDGVDVGLLNLSGIDIGSSCSRLSTISSNVFSIFAIVSALSLRRDDTAQGDAIHALFTRVVGLKTISNVVRG